MVCHYCKVCNTPHLGDISPSTLYPNKVTTSNIEMIHVCDACYIKLGATQVYRPDSGESKLVSPLKLT